MKGLFSKAQLILCAVMGLLLLTLLVMLAGRDNVQLYERRAGDSYVEVPNVSYTRLEQEDAPLGFVNEYRFVLGRRLRHDSILAFYSAHQYVDVYLGNERVYSLYPAEDIAIIRTVGSVWTRVPLYREDRDKEVRVVLTPVYESYQSQDIRFLTGSSLEIYKAQLRQSTPELILSLIALLVGVAYLCMAGYSLVVRRSAGNLFSLGLLAMALGLWRGADTLFSPFVMEKRPVFLFYLSVSMMALFIVPLLRSTRGHVSRPGERVRRLCCTAVVLAITVQLALQLLGIQDLREMLTFTHILLIGSALIVVGELLLGKLTRLGRKGGRTGRDLIWIIAVGALADVVSYYVRGTSNGLLLTLAAVLCYVLLEGISTWRTQTRLLKEKEMEVMGSKVTLMMSQIRSHFVFNLLNAISGLCKYDPEKADETIVRFARHLRNNINIMEDDSLVSFHAILQHLEDYIALEQVRFGDKIRFETDITVDQFRMPPLILQPVVENAIKYGLTPKPTGGTITLRTREVGGEIQIALEDDGVGFIPEELEKSDSVGLKNVRFRLRHQMGGRLDISSEIGRGTIVTITIPREDA